jgi:gamma-glutamylaminecyclotransferase
MDRIRLFVYGTLMSDGPRRAVLAGQHYLGRARTRQVYRLLDLGPYPGLLSRPHDGLPIEGELYDIDTHLLPVLDHIENVPTLYRRDVVELEDIAGPVVAYFYQGSTADAPMHPTARWDNTERPADDT